jgi:hypothetical protein
LLVIAVGLGAALSWHLLLLGYPVLQASQAMAWPAFGAWPVVFLVIDCHGD